MTADAPAPFCFEATVTHRDPELARRALAGPDAPRLDLLPPGLRASEDGLTAHAFVRPEDCAALLRAGFRVELTAIAEGPVDPARVMGDEQAQAALVQRVGADRVARAEEA